MYRDRQYRRKNDQKVKRIPPVTYITRPPVGDKAQRDYLDNHLQGEEGRHHIVDVRQGYLQFVVFVAER